MEIRAVLSEALNSMERARSLSSAKSDVELSALRWELYAALQNTLDSAAMLISDLGLRKPGSYADLGVALFEAGLVGEKTCNDIKVIAVVRNALAHAYRRLSAADLGRAADDALPRVRRVIESLTEILDAKKLDPSGSAGGGARLDEVFRRHKVALAYLFGSRAKGLERPESDYDIAALFRNREVTLVDEARLAVDVAEALQAPADRVSVVALNNADPLLKLRVLKEGKPLYEQSEKIRTSWERSAYLEALRAMDLYAVCIARAFRKRLGELRAAPSRKEPAAE